MSGYGGERSFKAENKVLGGDPFPGQPKKLSLGFIDGRGELIMRKSGNEGEWINFTECQ